MPHYSIRDARTGDEERIQHIVSSVLQEYGFNLDLTGYDSDLIDVGESYRERGGVFRVIVGSDDRIYGCGGLYPLTEGEIELRKMYFLPPLRGQGLGRALLNDLIERARELGFRRIVLETADVLHDAIALYERNGFAPIERPLAGCRCDRAFGLDLRER